jgi:hypothetical protein
MTSSEHRHQLRVAAARAVVDHVDKALTTLRDELDDGSKLAAGRAVALAEIDDAPCDLTIGKWTLWPQRDE